MSLSLEPGYKNITTPLVLCELILHFNSRFDSGEIEEVGHSRELGVIGKCKVTNLTVILHYSHFRSCFTPETLTSVSTNCSLLSVKYFICLINNVWQLSGTAQFGLILNSTRKLKISFNLYIQVNIFFIYV